MKNKETKVIISIEAEDKASASIKRFRDKFKNFRDADNHFYSVQRRMRSTTRALERYADKFKDIGKSLTLGITAPIGILSGLGILIAANFEKEMLKAKAATKGILFDDLKKEALSQASKSMFSPSQAAQGIRWLGQGGMDSGDIIKSLGPTLELAASGDTDLGYTADILGGIQNTFGFKADKSGSTVDKLVTTFSGSAQTLNDLSESIRYSGFVGRGADQSFDSVLFALSTLADSNIKGSVAGTGLSSVFEAFINQEPKFIKAWKRIGLGKTDLIAKDHEGEEKTKPLLDILKVLKKKNVEARELFQMFGVQGGRAMLALLGKPLDKLQDKFKDISENYQGRAKQFAESRTEGFWGQFGILKSNLQTLSEKLFGASGFVEAITSIFALLSEKLGGFNKHLSKETSRMMLKLAGLAAVIGPLVFGLGVIYSLYAKFMAWYFGLSGAVAIFKFLAWRTLAFTSIVGVVVGLLYTIWEYWDEIKEELTSLKEKLSTFFNDPWGSIKKSLDFSPEGVLGKDWKSKYNKSSITSQIKETVSRTENHKTEQKKTVDINIQGIPPQSTIKESGEMEDWHLTLGYALDGRF